MKAVDHKGQKFPTITAMCKHYGISNISAFRERRRKGLSLEEALTKPVRDWEPYINRSFDLPAKDHLGTEFPTRTEMCKAYGLQVWQLSAREGLGWTREEALTGKRNDNRKDNTEC